MDRVEKTKKNNYQKLHSGSTGITIIHVDLNSPYQICEMLLNYSNTILFKIMRTPLQETLFAQPTSLITKQCLPIKTKRGVMKGLY